MFRRIALYNIRASRPPYIVCTPPIPPHLHLPRLMRSRRSLGYPRMSHIPLHSFGLPLHSRSRLSSPRSRPAAAAATAAAAPTRTTVIDWCPGVGVDVFCCICTVFVRCFPLLPPSIISPSVSYLSSLILDYCFSPPSLISRPLTLIPCLLGIHPFTTTASPRPYFSPSPSTATDGRVRAVYYSFSSSPILGTRGGPSPRWSRRWRVCCQDGWCFSVVAERQKGYAYKVAHYNDYWASIVCPRGVLAPLRQTANRERRHHQLGAFPPAFWPRPVLCAVSSTSQISTNLLDAFRGYSQHRAVCDACGIGHT
ncbi:hypothetical protein PYCCODRAFT_1435317 [Trametes coccinea BRFM310]|uniref:Uncharacterized protein n=1 Tax=Trametes coccinea (strain BRFM310) TaxID=1353009 RepID=A0A1Y2IR18_TRAC3|nr:hypothetical protein PYCCODRAFT_1435317 [Trametes coccinea BRFM310]